jgi:ABC-type uncharacterized transport system permease subunit
MNETAVTELAWWGVALSLLSSMLRVTLPLVFASMGGLWSERSGVVNIALEGKMMVGAFVGAVVCVMTGSPLWGWLAAGVGGMLFAAIYGVAVIGLKADQIVAGTAMNFLAMGIPPFFSKILFERTTSTPSIPLASRYDWEPFLWAALVWAFTYYVFKYTPLGLWLSFSGEKRQALEAAGVRHKRIKWIGVLAAGLFAGWGGATLSMALSSSFARGMTGGRGFMALAALILGKWKPIPTLFACLLFGLAEAAQIRLQGVVLWGTEPVPVQWIQILPYTLTLVAIAGVVGKWGKGFTRSTPPAELGRV